MLPIAFVTPRNIKVCGERKMHVCNTLVHFSSQQNYEYLIATFLTLSLRAINNIDATIAMALEKSAKFNFTIGENISQFLNWIFSIV